MLQYLPSTSSDRIAVVIKKLCVILEIQISYQKISSDLLRHPGYPNLLSISDVLTFNNIKNTAIRIDISKLDNMTFPCLALLRFKEGNHFREEISLIRSAGCDFVEFLDPASNKYIKTAKHGFEEFWPSGIVIIVEPEISLNDQLDSGALKEEKVDQALMSLALLAFPSILIMLALQQIVDVGWLAGNGILLILIFLVGIYISFSLVFYEELESSVVVEKLCGPTAKVNCGVVLNSKGSKIFGINWSVLGCSYYVGSLLILLLRGVADESVLFELAAINAIALPYIVYSISYQWLMVKQWCKLCLIVQFLLLLQSLVHIFGGFHFWKIETPYELQRVLTDLLVFAIPLYITRHIAKNLELRRENAHIERMLSLIKSDFSVFKAMLVSQRQVIIPSSNLGIYLGASSPKHHVLVVCNPYCGPCAAAHSELHKLIGSNEDVQVQVVFTATNSPGDRRNDPVSYIMAISESSPWQATMEALTSWFQEHKMNFDSFSNAFPVASLASRQGAKLASMGSWCEESSIFATPTIYVDGYKLPASYSVSDLKYVFGNR